MNVPRYAALAAKLLQRSEASARAGALDRAMGAQTVERARRMRRRRRWLRGAAGARTVAAAAAALWVALGGMRASAVDVVAVTASPTGRGGSVISANGTEPLRAGLQLYSGSRIDTAPEGGATLRLSTG